MAIKTFASAPRIGARPSGSNGRGGPPGPAASPPKGRVRLPELAIGLFVMVAFALGAVLWHLNSVDEVPALAVAADIDRGETIAADHIQVVYVAGDEALARLGTGQLGQVVGRVALVDLPAGTLMTRNLVADAAALQPGDGIAGLSLEPGQYPALGLAPGDRVNVVRSRQDGAEDRAETIIARNATVFAVEELASDHKLVSVRTSEADAEAIAAAAEGGSLRLVLVSP